ncbi:MAG: formate--tetrahydrofolate ligase [Planctomycetes bacterium]|nr:formate--tetrahydrofolate ligase [Planctomycetota bacterium]MCP4769883.1 formate--tetrahydrofolate ligase [Planctomycetota bacterium]MCP4859723.1 formate--tetrahydrofolate ligase [Planctomycetota bacterium]
MTTDVLIARQYAARPIQEIADNLGVSHEDLLPYGREIAKVDLKALDKPRKRDKQKLILVSAITPTPAGEGKTTTSIGLAQAFTELHESACLALREPSLGPCMGMKGGACGGGHSQVMPLDRINLHFTGDFHAITSAHNLLAALIDNHLHFGNKLGIDQRKITWPRVLDMNDRALRRNVTGLGGPGQGVPRESSFDITAASEVMAMLCLAKDADDLRARLNRTVIGYTQDTSPIFAEQMGSVGAMMALLRDAMNPNLVQTFNGTPAFIHGGPFANIAHGCNSVIATRMAMHFADWTITEAGFGADLGAEKFLDIKCRSAGLNPDAIVLVATIRALKMHGGIPVKELNAPNAQAVKDGLPNLDKHVENVRMYGKPAVVALNQFATDTPEEIEMVRQRCEELGIGFAASTHHAEGGPGAVDLAKAVMKAAEAEQTPLRPIYELDDPVEEKIRAVALKVYGAKDVEFDGLAHRQIKRAEELGYGNLPICIAKVPGSLSDDPKKYGRPTNFTITIRRVEINAGAGFLVVITGEIFRMPGLPRVPAANEIDLLEDGTITGVE